MNILFSTKNLMVTVVVMTVASCTSSKKEEAAFKEIIASLEESSKNLDYSSGDHISKIKEKSIEHGLKELAMQWQPRAVFIQQLKKETSEKIDSLANILTTENYGSILEEAAQTYDAYAKRLLQTDPEINMNFKDKINGKTNIENYHSPALATVFLAKLQYEVENLAYMGVAYCDNKVRFGCILRFDKIGFLVGQSSTVLLPGQELKISAGVGAYSTAASPVIRINNRNIPVSDAVANTTIKVENTPGNYAVPVDITYRNEDGEEKKATIKIEYRVVKAIE